MNPADRGRDARFGWPTARSAARDERTIPAPPAVVWGSGGGAQTSSLEALDPSCPNVLSRGLLDNDPFVCVYTCVVYVCVVCPVCVCVCVCVCGVQRLSLTRVRSRVCQTLYFDTALRRARKRTRCCTNRRSSKALLSIGVRPLTLAAPGARTARLVSSRVVARCGGRGSHVTSS